MSLMERVWKRQEVSEVVSSRDRKRWGASRTDGLDTRWHRRAGCEA